MKLGTPFFLMVLLIPGIAATVAHAAPTPKSDHTVGISGMSAAEALGYGSEYAKMGKHEAALEWYTIAEFLYPRTGGIVIEELNQLKSASLRHANTQREENPEPTRYRGFGGVSYGFVGFTGAKDQDDAYHINFKQKKGLSRTLGSDFLLRIADSRWFAGYAVAIQGGSTMFRSIAAAESGSGIKDVTPNSPCYGDFCFGTTSLRYLDITHVPIEANTAYTIDLARWNIFAGGGPSIHLAKATGFQADSTVQLFEYFSNSHDNITTVSSTKHSEAKKRGFSPGAQVFGGAGVELGQLPRLGGRWGLTLTAKYQYVRPFTMEVETTSKFKEYKTNGEVCDADANNGDTCEPIQDQSSKYTAIVSASSWSVRTGLVFYF